MDKNFFIQTTDTIAKWVSKINEKITNIFARFSGKKITVETEVKGAEKVEKTKQNIDSLGQAIKQLPEPSVSQWSKFSGVCEKISSGVRNLTSDLKGMGASLLSGGGGMSLLSDAFKSLVKIGQHFYNNWIDGMKEAAAMSERNAESIREAAEANEELRQKGDSYLKQLEQYSSRESLSNTNKAEAKKIIGELTKAYGDLGIKLDETTGKLTGVDSAMIRKGEKDKARRIKEMEAELREIQNENEQQAALRDKAGIPVWFGGDYRLGGKDTIEAAGKKIEENNKRAGEIRRRLNEERKKDPAAEIRSKRKAEVEDLEAQNRERQRAFEQKKADDAFASARNPEEKIANRQAVLNRHRQENLDPLGKKVAAAREVFQNASGDDQMEAKRNLLQLEKELQAEREKAYVWERQIAEIQKQQAEELSKQQQKEKALLRQQKQEKEEKAAALKSELSEKAQDLKGQAMERTDRSREAAWEKALRDAERSKGSKLTGEEAAQVRKLSDLTWDLNSLQAPQPGDLSVRTNSLTSRGGFSGGAVMPDSEKIAREACNYNKRQAETADRIMRFLEELGRN